MICANCKRERALIDGLCDDCTIAKYGDPFPWQGKQIIISDTVVHERVLTEEELQYLIEQQKRRVRGVGSLQAGSTPGTGQSDRRRGQ